MKSLTNLKKIDLGELVANLKSESTAASQEAGIKLAKDAAEFGLSVRDYLLLAVGREDSVDGLNGYEQVLYELNLPVKNDFENGVFLQAASETFQTHAGTRALFPEVIDDVVRFANRQDQFETVAPMLAQSRTIAGTEVLSTVIEDDEEARKTFSISELGNIPVRTIKTSEKTVKIYKHGQAIRTSYEFSRRASLDLLVPHANRIARELEISKVAAATGTLINGDGAYAAAPSVNQSSYNTEVGSTATDGQINWPHFLRWLVKRAEAGTPVDTVVMNWDGWFQWLMLFGKRQVGADNKSFGDSAVESLQKSGVNIQQMPAAIQMMMNITPVLSSKMPAGKLLGYSRGDTMEELIEAGSNIQETENAIRNQSITMVRTENTGYRLVYGDTRSIFVFDES